VRYVTEGLLRALSRAEVECPSNYRATWPYHSFTRKDAIAMPADAPQLLHFALLANGWRFAAGSRIRRSIAGADADHCAQVPHGRPPELIVHWGGEVASYITHPATAMARHAIVAGSDVARSTAAQR
jgi:predicted acyl esterase